jgi:hypothetical protein
MTGDGWPFAEPETTEVITLERIVRGASPVLLVTHDEDDGGWQFLDGGQVFEDEAVVVLLGEIVQLDPALLELADLPRGHYAWRPGGGRGWTRGQGEPPSTVVPERPGAD